MLTTMILRVLLTILRHDERSFSGSRDVQVIEVEAAGMKAHGFSTTVLGCPRFSPLSMVVFAMEHLRVTESLAF